MTKIKALLLFTFSFTAINGMKTKKQITTKEPSTAKQKAQKILDNKYLGGEKPLYHAKVLQGVIQFSVIGLQKITSFAQPQPKIYIELIEQMETTNPKTDEQSTKKSVKLKKITHQYKNKKWIRSESKKTIDQKYRIISNEIIKKGIKKTLEIKNNKDPQVKNWELDRNFSNNWKRLGITLKKHNVKEK